MILISERRVSSKHKEAILQNTRNRKMFTAESAILDEPGKITFDLRVPLYLKGNSFNMIIPSKIEFSEKPRVLDLGIYCSLLKPVCISLLLGGLGFLFFQWLYSKWTFSLIMLIASSSLQFGVMFYAIKKRSKEYLRELTKKKIKD